MILRVWSIVIVSITTLLLLYQIFSAEQSLIVYIAIFLGFIWSGFLLNTREIIRFFELAIIEVAVKILDLIAYIQGYKVRKADGPLLEQVYRLRHKVYLNAGIIEPHEDELFLDKYDPFATSLVVINGKQIVSSLRITFYNNPVKLSTLNYFNVDISKDELYDYVDISRWVSDTEYRAKKRKTPIVTMLLGLKMYLYLLKSRKRFILITIKSKLKNHLEKIFNIKFISPNMLPDTDYHEQSRKEVGGYFNKESNVQVCVLEVKTSYLWDFFYRF